MGRRWRRTRSADARRARFPTLPAPLSTAATALTAAVALLLTGCGGSDSSDPKDSDKIAGADAGSGSSKPSASAPGDGIERPEIKLPSDVENVFEGGTTGDPVKDAVLADNERRINSIDEAITVDARKYPALKFYSKGDALMSAASYIMSFRDENRSFTGKTRYYDREVTLHKAGAEGVWQTTTVSSTEAAKRCM